MYRRIMIVSSFFVLTSCGDKPVQKQENAAVAAPAGYKHCEGVYEGDFDGSPVTVVLRHISERTAVGYNVHKGLRRNISGEMTVDGSKLHFILHEPGDNPYDGVFDLILDTVKHEMRGSWTPTNDKGLTQKQLVLQRKPDHIWEQDGELEFYGSYNGKGHSSLQFSDDGQCRYEYYRNEADTTDRDQVITVRGSWHKLSDSTYAVDWQKNDKFKNSRTIFTVCRPSEENDYTAIIGDEGTRLSISF